MHHIQKNIILNLARTAPLRFSELQPPRVPNNTFSYHLKKLIASGYVESTPKGYIATRKALKTVAYGVSTTNRPPATPKIISMLYVENKAGEVLLINRHHQPFHNWYCLPSGLMHQGETLQQAAQRELHEKTTIEAQNELTNAGVLDIRYVDWLNDDIFMHMVAFIYTYHFDGDAEALNGKMTRSGQLLWSRLDRKNILPEVLIAQRLANRHEFAHESVVFAEPSQMPVVQGATALFTDQEGQLQPILHAHEA